MSRAAPARILRFELLLKGCVHRTSDQIVDAPRIVDWLGGPLRGVVGRRDGALRVSMVQCCEATLRANVFRRCAIRLRVDAAVAVVEKVLTMITVRFVPAPSVRWSLQIGRQPPSCSNVRWALHNSIRFDNAVSVQAPRSSFLSRCEPPVYLAVWSLLLTANYRCAETPRPCFARVGRS